MNKNNPIYNTSHIDDMRPASSSKQDRYDILHSQVASLIQGEEDLIANMANVASIVHETFGFWWTGFYIVKGECLVLGPFQGPVACTRIQFGKGVCGTAWKRKETVVVPDVEEFPGHIACSSLSRSEIVVPVFNAKGDVMAVFDIDSKELSTFDDTDKEKLEAIVSLLYL